MRCLWHLNNHDYEPARLHRLVLRKRSKDQWYGDNYTYAHVSVDFHSLQHCRSIDNHAHFSRGPSSYMSLAAGGDFDAPLDASQRCH